MTPLEREDLKRHTQFFLAVLGGAFVIGSTLTAAWCAGRDALAYLGSDCLDDC